MLLNARAIIKCKANLNFKEYPVFFLHLESSCMRQIRNIFGLKDDEFNENFSGPCEYGAFLLDQRVYVYRYIVTFS